jgi:spermidine/putrescine transport system permease protein
MKKNLLADFRKQLPFVYAIPAFIWQAIFFYVPVLFIVSMSFLKQTSSSSWLSFTLEHYTHFFHWVYFKVILVSFALAFANGLFCLLLAYPVAYFIAIQVRKAKTILLFFLILPFWTSLLVQVYSWFFILERHGLINSIALKLGLIKEPLSLMNNMFGIVIVMVFCYLPFMIMPIYSILEKIDRRLFEASSDLGASSWQTLIRVTIPLSLPGIKTGFFLVFVPSFGEFVVPTLLGGGKNLLVGSLISHYFLVARDPFLGAAYTCLSGLLLITVSWSIHKLLQRQINKLNGVSV